MVHACVFVRAVGGADGWGKGHAMLYPQRAQLTHMQRQSGTCTTLDWPDTCREWWVANGAWSARGRVERAAPPPHNRTITLFQGSICFIFHEIWDSFWGAWNLFH
jgi:hypothetical protein